MHVTAQMREELARRISMTDDRFKRYQRTTVSELRPYEQGEDLTGVSIAEADAKAGSPRDGDWIARNPENHEDQWLLSAAYHKAQKFKAVE